MPAILLRGLEGLRSPWIGIRAPCPYATLLALALVVAPALAPALALRHRSSLDASPRRRLFQGHGAKKTKISVLGQTLTDKPQAWLGAHENRQDPGENWRRIEHFIGENEHL